MANAITILRMILALLVIGLLFINSIPVYITAFVLTIIVIWFDGLDGYIARKFNEVTKFGAVLDILGDRVVENAYWIAFAGMGWIPVWVPIVVAARGIITDGLRSVALEQGYTAFGSSTMMESKIGKFIVASNFSRFSYAVFKAIAFSLMIAFYIPTSYKYQNIIGYAAYFSAYASVFFCVVRGIPVVIESRKFFPSK